MCESTVWALNNERKHKMKMCAPGDGPQRSYDSLKIRQSYLEPREGCPRSSKEITTSARYPYPDGVPCFESQYGGITGSISTSCPPTWVRKGQEL